MYGSFRTLTNKILEYLSAESPQDLFAKILERLEDDYEIGENARYLKLKIFFNSKLKYLLDIYLLIF